MKNDKQKQAHDLIVKKLKNPFYEGHKYPVSRRDFIKMGAIPVAGSIMMPALAPSLFSLTAKAADAKTRVPFLVFDLAGGAAMPGNFLVGQKGGPEDFLPDYDTFGWNPRASGALDKSFGLPMAANNVSRMLTGLNQACSADARKNLRMGSLCSFTNDDTSTNATSALAYVSSLMPGSLLPNGLGSRNSFSGGNPDVSIRENAYRPVFVSSVKDVMDSVGLGSTSGQYADSDVELLIKTVAQLSSYQLDQLKRILLDEKHKNELKKEVPSFFASLGSPSLVDPRKDPIFSQVYNVRDGSQETGADVISATIATNVLKRTSGPGCITIGSCDYHDGTQNTGDNKDQEIGTQIGRAVEAAHRLKTPLFFQVLTDGGVSASGGRTWGSDSAIKSLTVIGYYNPKGPAEQRRIQVGDYTRGGGVNLESIIGAQPTHAAAAVFANYLSIHGEAGKLGDILRRDLNPFSDPSSVDSVLIF